MVELGVRMEDVKLGTSNSSVWKLEDPAILRAEASLGPCYLWALLLGLDSSVCYKGNTFPPLLWHKYQNLLDQKQRAGAKKVANSLPVCLINVAVGAAAAAGLVQLLS